MTGINQHQRGVGLIEVLVAVLVLAFGMLGLVGLQVFSLKHNQSALERGMAVVQTHSILDAMRADRTNAINKKFNIALGAVPKGDTFPELSIIAWRSNLKQALGDGADGSIDCNGQACTVVVKWRDDRTQDAKEAAQTVTTEVRL